MPMNSPIASSIRGLFDLRGSEIKVFMVCEAPPTNPATIFNHPSMALEVWRKHVARASWYDPDKEMVVVVCLDRKNHIKAWNLVSIGTATSSLMHPREVLRPVIACAATAFVVMHNHPSGDPSPSDGDRETTSQVRQAAYWLGVDFQDHVIIGRADRDPRRRGYYSLTEEDERRRAENERRQRAELEARQEARKQARAAKLKAKEAAAA